MSAITPSIVLVTPVYRDSQRLSVFAPSLAKAFAESHRTIKWVVADDGSGEEEVRRLQELIEIHRKTHPDIELHEAGKHLGKGGTVRCAWKSYSDADWLAFVDADGSIDAESLLKLIEKAVEAGPGHAVIASRRSSPETTVIQKPLRKITHRTFAALARAILNLPVRDLQCGAKVIDSTAFRAIAPQLVEDGFAFDAELLAALHRHGVKLIEIPVNWAEKSRGSVNPFVQAWPMLAAIFRVRRRRSTGHYDPVAE